MNSLFRILCSTLRKKSRLLAFFVLFFSFGMGSRSAVAAERVYASYSALERSISVAALEDYAKTGAIDDDLAVYTQYIQPQQFQELRRVLLSPIKISPVAVSQFLYTPQGEFLLRRLSQVVRTESRQPESSLHALRSALILAADEPGGLTLLNLLKQYPTSSIRIDLARSLGIAAELEQLVSESSRAIAAVSLKSTTEAATTGSVVNLSQLPDLRRKGRFAIKKYQITAFDAVRQRYLQTDVYVSNNLGRSPAIVISHGVGSDSSNFEYLASHLATHGFAVIVPNHPGSDSKLLRSLLDGRAGEVAEPEEFKNRPKDVTFILNELEELSKTDPRFKGKINLENVGIIGHSFGGYTALALAGAKLNFEKLEKDCQAEKIKETWNISLLLQCQALQLPGRLVGQEYNLRDERIKAVIAINPITSSVFGEAGLKELQTPVMLVSSSDDTIAPALYEQIQPFSWINNTQKYLVSLVGASHFSVIGSAAKQKDQIALPSAVVGDDPAQARRYMTMLSVPFFQTYVVGSTRYTRFLSAAYASAISNQSMGLNLIQSLTPTELAQAMDGSLGTGTP